MSTEASVDVAEETGTREATAAGRDGLSARWIPLDELGEAERAMWRDLETRAVEPNPYLSADFVLPAVRYVAGDDAPRVLLVEDRDAAESRLVGLALFRERERQKRFPFRHLAAYRTPHTFLGGVYLDASRASAAADSLAASLCDRSGVHGVYFRDILWEGPSARHLREAFRRNGASWYGVDDWERAVLAVERRRTQDPGEYLSSSRTKNYRRYGNKLERMGAVDWRCIRGEDLTDEEIETLLRLEHSGWKGREGTSLLSSDGDTAFFRETMKRFARRGDAFFTELTVDGEVVASTANFVVGSTGFGFKIGWDEDYKDASPGFLNEVRFLYELADLDLGMQTLDSGAPPGSYMESLWPDRSRIASGYFVTSALARSVSAGLRGLRGAKRALVGAVRQVRSDDD